MTILKGGDRKEGRKDVGEGGFGKRREDLRREGG